MQEGREARIDSKLDVILALAKARAVLWPAERRWWPQPPLRRPVDRWQRSLRQRRYGHIRD